MNKSNGSSAVPVEGVQDNLKDDLAIEMGDEELLKLAQQWETDYAPYESKIKIRQDANRTFYLGRQKEGGPEATGSGEAISANLLFEAEETFLPAALSKNPEPVVWADNTAEGNAISNATKTMLKYHADTLVLRRTLTLMVRNWSIDFLGVVKHGWDPIINDIKLENRDVKNFVFDPNGYVDAYGDFVGYLGERISITASKLIAINPQHSTIISELVEGKLGSKVVYTQWWNDDYFFETFKGIVLDKGKNPHFNYPSMETQTDEFGGVMEVEAKTINHFAAPKKPYTFLSVFTLGQQPHDVTGLIEQNIPNQRRVTRRTEQIDYNLSRQNNSDVFSEANFNQETAKQAASAMAKGHPILVPQGGSIDEAVKRLSTQGVDSSFFAELENSKNDLRQIFGTQGITAQQPDEDQTARGMILNQQFDNSRIGGGVGDAIEQVADNIFNWWVQLYHVYYDTKHFASILGQMKAVEYVTLSRDTFLEFGKRVVVSVAPNSLKPEDEVTEMNQAIALYEKGALDPKTLLTVLDFPDPQKTAENVVLWKIDPVAYMQINFPELAMKMQQNAQAQMMNQAGAGGPPPEAITEPPPPEGLSMPEASSDLGNVPLPA